MTLRSPEQRPLSRGASPLLPSSLLLPALLLAGCSGKGAAPAAGDSGSRADGAGDYVPTGEPTAPLYFTGPRPVNVLLITIDTLRRDSLGFYGGGDTSPSIDRLLEDAVVLDRHRSCGNWTFPSMACLLTGRYNESVGYYPEQTGRYPEAPSFLAEILRDRGYDTRLIGAQDVLTDAYNVNQGYAHREVDKDWDAAAVSDRALAQAEQLLASPTPWLLHIHYLDPHMPYTPPEGYADELDYEAGALDLRSFGAIRDLPGIWDELDDATRAEALEEINGLYNGDIRFTDEQIGRVLVQLAGAGVMDQTLVVIASDHGEQFYEHGQFEHSKDLYGEETRCLAALSAPGLKPMRIDANTSHTDLLPIILDALGIDALPPEVDGATLGAFPRDRPVYSSMASDFGVGQAIEIEDQRLHYWWDGRAAWYSLGTDPGELSDHYEPDDEMVQLLWQVLAPYTAAMDTLLERWSPAPVE